MNDPVSVLLDNKASVIHAVSPDATVQTAVQKMVEARIGAVLVVEDGELVGIFSERDVLVRVVNCGRDPATTPVAHVMTHDPETVEASTTIDEVLDLHGGKEFRHLPVTEEGDLVGIVSFRDIYRWVAQHHTTQPA